MNSRRRALCDRSLGFLRLSTAWNMRMSTLRWISWPRFALPCYLSCFKSCSAQVHNRLKGPLRLSVSSSHFPGLAGNRLRHFLNKILLDRERNQSRKPDVPRLKLKHIAPLRLLPLSLPALCRPYTELSRERRSPVTHCSRFRSQFGTKTYWRFSSTSVWR